MGLSPYISLHCPNCCDFNSYMKYNGGQSTKRENCSWHTLNNQLVLGTLATGLGPADLPPLLSFMVLPHSRSSSNLQYRRIESLIGTHLRKIAEESMQNELETEVS